MLQFVVATSADHTVSVLAEDSDEGLATVVGDLHHKR